MCVRDGEARLQRDVQELLDTLPDLTPFFEILIIDDGSVDDTVVLARDLARRFPQVRVLRRPLPYGPQAALELGLRNTSGEFVLVKETDDRISPIELDAVWQLREDPELVMVQWPQASEGTAASRGIRSGSVRMLRRTAIQRLADCADPEEHLRVQPYWRQDRSGEVLPENRPPYLIRVTHAFQRDDARLVDA